MHIKKNLQHLISTVVYIDRNEKKDEPIFLYNYLLQKFFPYYYKGSNSIIGLPEAIDTAKRYNVSNWAYRNSNEVKNNWGQFKNLKTFWVVTNNSNSNIDMECNLIITSSINS